jgi:hypothetical protein
MPVLEVLLKRKILNSDNVWWFSLNACFPVSLHLKFAVSQNFAHFLNYMTFVGQDKLLVELVRKFNGSNWKQIGGLANLFHSAFKNVVLCKLVKCGFKIVVNYT